MNRIKVITIGKLKNSNLSEEVLSLLKRLKKVELIELKEVKGQNIDEIKKKEFDLFSKYLDSNSFKVLLWERGNCFDTKGFFEKFKKIEGDVVFFITGAFGPNMDLISSCDLKLSLSPMTFTHEQALYMLIEQIYRYDCFVKGIDYTK